MAVGRMRLTRRQGEIMALVREGRADKEIAVTLGMSVATVRTHLQRVYRHNGLRNRTEAVAVLLVNTNSE